MTPEEFRRHFPIFRDRAYFGSCSAGALSDRVQAALAQHLDLWRTQGAPWDAWMGAVADARRMFAQLIGAEEDEVAAISCASEGAYHVASSLSFQGRRQIVSSDMEFPSIAHVWLGQESRGAQVRFSPGGLRPTRAAFTQCMDPETALVSIPLVGYADGYRPPVGEVIAQAHALGALTFVDAYQGAGVMPIDVRSLGCDFLVAGALKYLLGAPGMAFLYVRKGLWEDLRPPLTGWFARREPFAFDPRQLDYAPSARRFQTGTPAVAAGYAAVAGLSLILDLDLGAVQTHIARLADRLQSRLLAQGTALASPLDPLQRGPQIAVRAQDSAALGAFLAQRGVVGAARGEALRLSLHHYNSDQDVDRAVDALAAFAACR